MHEQFDAAIVGAGPAGASAAITLCRRGVRTALIEARSFPHDKLCGEFLSPECASLLDRLGVSVSGLHARTVSCVHLSAPDGHTAEISFPQPGWGISRRLFDATLAQKALNHGAELFERTTVEQIRGNLDNGFVLDLSSGAGHSQILARTVIAGHGKRSLLDRQLGRPFLQRRQPFVALKRHYRGPALNGRIALHSFPGGYCGFAEIEGGLSNTCLLVKESVFRSSNSHGNERVESFVEWMKRQNARISEWFAEATPVDEHWLSIAQVPFVSKSPTAGDILMAGDASGVIAPLAGNGIAIALESGTMAGNVSFDFLSGSLGPADLPIVYTAQWRRAFQTRLRIGRLIQQAVLYPRLCSTLLRLNSCLPETGKWLMEHTRNLDGAA